MAIPSTTQEMLRYYMQLNEAEQQSVLQLIKTFINNRKEHYKTVTLEEYYHELELADAEMKARGYILHN